MLLVLIVLCAVIQNRQKKAIRKKSVADVGVVSSGTEQFFFWFLAKIIYPLKTTYLGHFFRFSGQQFNICLQKLPFPGILTLKRDFVSILKNFFVLDKHQSR